MFNIFGSRNLRILKKLKSNSEHEREKAKKILSDRKFNSKELLYLYNAIQYNYPDDNNKYFSTKSKLIQKLWETNDEKTSDFIMSIFPNLHSNEDSQFYALRTLSEIGTAKAIENLFNLLERYDKEIKCTYYTVFVPFYQNPIYPELVIHRALSLLKLNHDNYSIYYLLVKYREKGLLDLNTLEKFKEKVIEDYRHSIDRRQKIFNDIDKATEIVDLIALQLDFLGSYQHDDEIINILFQSLIDSSPKIVMCSALSLIRLNQAVPKEHFEIIALNPEMRLYLYDGLEALEKLKLFPKEFMTQKYFAEGDMIRWLCFPTEFGRPPEKIELIESRKVNLEGQKGRVYLFKYWFPDEESWMVGLSGPQPEELSKVKSTGYLTFSNFAKLEELSIDEHFDAFLGE